MGDEPNAATHDSIAVDASQSINHPLVKRTPCQPAAKQLKPVPFDHARVIVASAHVLNQPGQLTNTYARGTMHAH